jgi:hypothetical protein
VEVNGSVAEWASYFGHILSKDEAVFTDLHFGFCSPGGGLRFPFGSSAFSIRNTIHPTIFLAIASCAIQTSSTCEPVQWAHPGDQKNLSCSCLEAFRASHALLRVLGHRWILARICSVYLVEVGYEFG